MSSTVTIRLNPKIGIEKDILDRANKAVRRQNYLRGLLIAGFNATRGNSNESGEAMFSVSNDANMEHEEQLLTIQASDHDEAADAVSPAEESQVKTEENSGSTLNLGTFIGDQQQSG